MHPLRKNNSRRHRRRRLSALAAAPAAAVGSCLVALSLNRGDPTVGAFLAAGSARSPATCFLARCGVAGEGLLPAGRGRGGVTPVSVPSSAVTASRRTGAGRRRPCSLLGGPHPSGDVDRELSGLPWGAAAGFDVSRERFRCGTEAGAGARLSMLTASAKTTDGGGGSVGVDGLGIGVTGTGDVEEDSARFRKNLSKMMLPELKALYRAGGGKPGTLRKAELLERLSRATLEHRVPGDDDSGGRSDELRPAVAMSAASAAGPKLETAMETATSHPSDAAMSLSSSSVGDNRIVRSVCGGGGDSAVQVMVDGQEDAAIPLGDGCAAMDDAPEPAYRAGASDSANHVSRAGASRIAHADHASGISDAAGVHESGRAGKGGASVATGVDTMSSRPAAVMSAARARGAAAQARGAAAQAASARVAGTRRASEVAKAKRHSESVRVRAANAWRQSAEGQQHQGHGVVSSPELALAEAAGAAGNRREQARGEIGSGDGWGGWGGDGAGEGDPAVPAAPPAADTTELSEISATEGYRHPPPRQPAHMLRSNNNSPGRRGATSWRERGEPNDGGYGYGNDDVERMDGGGGRGGGGAQANRPRAGRGDERVRAAGVPRVNVGRVRLMPRLPNPWTRAGRGGAAEGLSEEGDVVEEFLTDTMMQPSDIRHVSSGDALFNREDRFEGMAGTSMQLNFIGTASCIPSTSRGVSCTVLRSEGDLWMFDVGEGTQVQIQKSSIKPTKISKIFITHAHGDHSFGLPGMLCLMGRNYERAQDKRVEIYGPTGLRAYLRAALRYTNSKVTAPYVVHELRDVPYLHGDTVAKPDDFFLDIAQDFRFGEQRGGRDIYPDHNGHYELYQDEKAIVRAAAMKHGVPCVGYCVEEPDRPGRLNIEHISPILNEHKEAVMEATGRNGVGWILGDLKAMKPGESMTLPGTDCTIDSAEAVSPSTKGRKVVILGDTCDASSMVPIAMGADVVVHEATNAFLYPLDQGKTYTDVERDAVKHGHSTPVMAAAFAEKVGAKMLVLNHFSARYRGDPSDASAAVMQRIELQAMRAGGLERHQVVAAWDLLQLPVLAPDLWEPHQKQAREDDAAHATAMLERATAWRNEQDPGPLTYPASATEEATLAGDDFDFIDEDQASYVDAMMPPQQTHAGAGEGNARSGGVTSSRRARREEAGGGAGARDAGGEGSASAVLGTPSSAKLARIERNNAVIFGRQEGQGARGGVPKEEEGRGRGAGGRYSVPGEDVMMHNILQALRPEGDGVEIPAGGMLASSQRRSAGGGG